MPCLPFPFTVPTRVKFWLGSFFYLRTCSSFAYHAHGSCCLTAAPRFLLLPACLPLRFCTTAPCCVRTFCVRSPTIFSPPPCAHHTVIQRWFRYTAGFFCHACCTRILTYCTPARVPACCVPSFLSARFFYHRFHRVLPSLRTTALRYAPRLPAVAFPRMPNARCCMRTAFCCHFLLPFYHADLCRSAVSILVHYHLPYHSLHCTHFCICFLLHVPFCTFACYTHFISLHTHHLPAALHLQAAWWGGDSQG